MRWLRASEHSSMSEKVTVTRSRGDILRDQKLHLSTDSATRPLPSLSYKRGRHDIKVVPVSLLTLSSLKSTILFYGSL